MRERPDGSIATHTGIISIIIGVLGAIFAANSDTINSSIFGVVIANLGIGLGVILLSLGYLVKAISFLPGREIDDTLVGVHETSTTFENDDQGVQKKSKASENWEDCTWCGLRIYSPSLPCSQQSEDAILSELSNSDNIEDKCRAALIERSYL